MSQQVDSSLSVPAPLPSVRALQSSPEVLTPVRHGFLWKRSRLFKTWISRWFQLDENGFVYAVSPKVIRREGRYVLPNPVREVLPLPQQRYANGATMYGLRVVSISGSHKDVYTDDSAALDAWALDLARSTPAARQHTAAKAAAAAAAAPPLLQLPLPARPPVTPGELHLGDICETDWSSMLGSGLFACVLRARMHVTGEPVAVKVIKAEAFREYCDIVQREAAVWAAAGVHPHIAHLRQTLRSSERMYFISELCDGGGLVERLAGSATYCEREVAWLTRQLLAAVQHLHDNAIVHMDIKPENVVFATRRDDSPIKLIDFSLASFFYSPTDPGGTPDFVAPELLNRPDHYAKNGCGPEVDMWAVGVMIFFLLSGQTPFQAPSLDQVLERVKSGEWAFHGRRWALVSEGARDLVASLLRVDPSARLTAAEALHHPWLRRPDSLSQALLQDAVAAFRSTAAATQQQLRTSWIKQGSGDLMITTGTNLSPHTSLSRFALMAGIGMGAPSVGAGGGASQAGGGAGFALASGGGQSIVGLMSTGVADAGGSIVGGAGTAASGGGAATGAGSSAVINSSNSTRQINSGVGRRVSHTSLAGGGQRASAMSTGTAAAAAAASGGGSGSGGPSPSLSPPATAGQLPQPHSFTAGVGARYSAALAIAPHFSVSGNGSPPRAPSLPPGALSAAAAASTAAGAAAAARISPHHSTSRLSPHHSRQSPVAAARSPRSPLGMRTRRASDTMAYTLAITERQESLTQMQAQGLPVDGNSGMPWPGKARRASAMPGFGPGGGFSPSASQAELAAAAVAAAAAASASVDRSNHSAPGMRQPSYPYGGYPYAGGTAGHMLRGASGLSVMTSATGGLPGSRRAPGGRSTSELITLGRVQSLSNGGRSGGATSSLDTGSHASSRDTLQPNGDRGRDAPSRSSWTHLTSAGPSSTQASQPQPQGQGQGATSPSHQLSQQRPQADSNGGGRAGTGAAAAAASAATAGTASDQPLPHYSLGASLGSRQMVPGKSHSYNVMPSSWLDSQGRALSRGQSSGQAYQTGPAAAGLAAPTVTSGALQRRASMSFTMGASAAGIALMPHGPSPLSNSSGGRNFLAGAIRVVDQPSGGGGSAGAGTATAVAASAQAPAASLSSGGAAAPALVTAAAAAGPTAAASTVALTALGRRPSRGGAAVAGGGGGGVTLSTRSSGSIAAYGLGSTGGGSGGGGTGPMPGVAPGGGSTASSMYAAVLRANLSGQSLNVGGAAAGSGSGIVEQSAGPGDSGGRRASRSGSGTAAAATSEAAAGATGGSASPTSRSPPLSVINTTADGVDAGGALPSLAGNAQTDSDGRIFPGISISSSSNVALSGSAAMLVSERGASYVASGDHASSSGQRLAKSSAGMLPSAPRPATGAGIITGAGVGAAAESSAWSFLTSSTQAAAPVGYGSGVGRDAGEPSDVACAPGPSGTLQSPAGAAAAMAAETPGSGSGGVRAAVVASLQQQRVSDDFGSSRSDRVSRRPTSGKQQQLVVAGDWPTSGSSPRTSVSMVGTTAVASGGVDAAAAATAGGGGSTGGTEDLLRSGGLIPRANRLVLETIPSEDPDSLSGLLRLVREERAAAAAAAAAGGSGPAATGASTNAESHEDHQPQQPLRHEQPQQHHQLQRALKATAALQARSHPRAFLSPQASNVTPQSAAPAPWHSAKEASDSGAGGAGSGRSGESSERTSVGSIGSRSSASGALRSGPSGGLGAGGAAAAAAASYLSQRAQSSGAGRPGSVRRVATVNNLRLHATTAAAAQAAQQAAAQAAQAAQHAAADPDPFAAWDYPPPSLQQQQQQQQQRQRATSAVGLSGASLVALLEQAAPLAQAAQAFAAAQIASSQSGSFTSGSFTSLRAHSFVAPGTGGGASMSFRSGGIPGIGEVAGVAGTTSATLPTHQQLHRHNSSNSSEVPESPFSGRARRASTAANLPNFAGIVGGGGGGGGGGGPGSSSGRPFSDADSPVGGRPQLSAQMSYSQLGVMTSRANSISSLASAQSVSPSATAAAAAGIAANAVGASSAAGGSGRVGGVPLQQQQTVSGSFTGGGGGGEVIPGFASVAASGTPPVVRTPSWARKATTSADLRERVLGVQLSGNSMMHRLATQQGPSAPVSASGSGPAASTGGGGGAAAGAALYQQALYSSSPPRDAPSPSTRGSFPAVPSRLSNSGNATPTSRTNQSGLFGPAPGSPSSHNNNNAATAGAVQAPPQSTGTPRAATPSLSSQQSLSHQTLSQQSQQAPTLQSQSSAPVTYAHQLQQLQHLQQMHQLQQLQNFHTLQQQRYQQQKHASVTAAAMTAARVSGAESVSGPSSASAGYMITSGGGSTGGRGSLSTGMNASGALLEVEHARSASFLEAQRRGGRRASQPQLMVPSPQD